MLKRIFKGAALLLGIVLLLVIGGVGWVLNKHLGHLTPPPNPDGQASITQYVLPEEPAAVAPVDLLGSFNWDSIATPPKHARAWTRWWWPGGDVEAEMVVNQLKQLDAAGFGGVEIQPFISGVIPVMENEALMQRVYSFDTPEYYRVLGETITAADQLGMQVDLTHFSGWPPGGPEVNLEDSLTIAAYGEEDISGGRSIKLELPKPKAGPNDYILTMMEFAGTDFMNFAVDHAQLLSVVAGKPIAGERAWNPFVLNDTVALEPDSLQVLTDHVKNGVLEWDAPEGEWKIIASYLLPSGEVPMGAAQKPQGFVIDHLRVPQVLGHYEYAYGERTGLPKFYGKGLRGFFNDSLEFRLKRMSVEDILGEFQTRRGYSLEPYLPAIYVEGVDNVYFKELMGIYAAPEFRITADDDRIRHDYQQTLSDLVIDRFVETSADWAANRGLISRAQSYGMDIDIIRALGANTIPETEQLWAGGADIGLKFASSASALYGRPLTSAESFVWVNRDYTVTARRIKAAADKLLLAGINQIIYHGTPYAWPAGETGVFGEEGWAPFSGPKNPAHFSGNVSAGNTALWPDMPELNTYIARSQNLLRQGTPDVDVLVYYPFLGFHGPNPEGEQPEALLAGALPDADPANVMLEAPELKAGKEKLKQLMTVPPEHEDERSAWMQKLQPLLRELDKHGISWAWVNAHAIETGKLADGRLTASGGRFGAVLLPDVDRIEQQTLADLGALAQSGTSVYLAGRQPSQQPGFRDAAQGDAAVQQALRNLLDAGAHTVGYDAQAVIEVLRQQQSKALAYDGESQIKHYQRSLNVNGGNTGGSIHFFGNQSPGREVLSLNVSTQEPLWWFDAMQGTAWPAEVVDGKLTLSLAGFESRFLIVGVAMPAQISIALPAGALIERADSSRILDGWDFSTPEGYSASWTSLPDWRDVDALKYAREGNYSNQFVLDEKAEGARYLLNLGLVQGSATVSVNGQKIGGASLPPFILDVTDAVRAGNNEIAIDVRAPLRNAFVGLALAGDPRYSHMEGYSDQLVAAGLVGPVELRVTR